MNSHWHTSLSCSAHQTLLARDFTGNENKALSFSIDNVIAIGNEAIKTAIKVLIWLLSSRIWPFVMPIFPCALRQVLWDSSLYLFKIKGLSNNKKRWQPALAYVGSIYWTMGKVREWELSSLLFSPSLCQKGPSPETFGQFVWSKQESHAQGKQQSPEWYFRLTQSLTCCQILHLFPFWCSLLADFHWLVLFCLAFSEQYHLFTARQEGSYLILFPKDFWL